MTENKRFVKTHKTINWWAVLDNGKELLEDEVVELLNELQEENQSLKEEKKFLQNKIKTYKSGNALLKKTLDKELEE